MTKCRLFIMLPYFDPDHICELMELKKGYALKPTPIDRSNEPPYRVLSTQYL